MNKLGLDFEEAAPAFIDATDPPPANRPWAPVIVRKEQIDAEVERLASRSPSEGGRRQSLITHPRAHLHTPGLAPGIQVTLSVLKPGEQTEPFRHNATEVNCCIRGNGYGVVGERKLRFDQYDVWNTPSYVPSWRANGGDDLQVCITYSNTSLLQFMQVYLWEANPSVTQTPNIRQRDHPAPHHEPLFRAFPIGDDSAMLLPYELLINPPAVESKALLWPWQTVRAELEKLESLGSDYVGHRLYLLYNPITGRTHGTTPNFFAAITLRPPGIVDLPHRHVSAAINYYFHGRGRSSVARNVYEWSAGDLMFSAPGWAVHNQASYDENVYELTVQDHPLNIAMEALLWQEDMKAPPALLGTELGFATNRETPAGKR